VCDGGDVSTLVVSRFPRHDQLWGHNEELRWSGVARGPVLFKT